MAIERDRKFTVVEGEGKQHPLLKGYREDRFYTASSDPGNAGGNQYFMNSIHLPQSWRGSIDAVRGEFPELRSNSDFVRDAIHHRTAYLLQRMTDPTPELRFWFDQRTIEGNALAVEAMSKARVEFVGSMIKRMQTAEQQKDWGALDVYLEISEDWLNNPNNDERTPDYKRLGEETKKFAQVMARARDNGEWKDRVIGGEWE